MFNKIKTYFIYILLVLILIIGFYALIQTNRANNFKHKSENLSTELNVKTGKTLRYINKFQQEVFKTNEYEKTIEELKYSNDSLETKIFKIIQASDLKIKQLKEAYNISLNVSGGGKYDSIIYIHINDTIHHIINTKVKYFNDYYLSAVIYRDSINYTYNDNIILIKAKRQVLRRIQPFKWIGWEWKKIIDKDLVEIVSDNPNAKYNGRIIKLIK